LTSTGRKALCAAILSSRNRWLGSCAVAWAGCGVARQGTTAAVAASLPYTFCLAVA